MLYEVITNSIAYYYMAQCYYNGYYFEVDFEKAVEYLQPALEDEYDWAQAMMGWMYYEGEGVEQSYEQAAYYYELAAEQGNPMGMNNLGDLFETGLGVEQDYDMARITSYNVCYTKLLRRTLNLIAYYAQTGRIYNIRILNHFNIIYLSFSVKPNFYPHFCFMAHSNLRDSEEEFLNLQTFWSIDFSNKGIRSTRNNFV